MKGRFLTLPALLVLTGCLHNDLPYPHLVPAITEIEVKDAVKVDVDNDRQSVNIVLTETADITKVSIGGVSYSADVTTSEPAVVAVHDLSEPRTVTLHTYQDYTWTISATQPVERWFNVRGQVGASAVDDVNRRVVVYVNGACDLEKMDITSYKLGPEGISSYEPDLYDVHDFSDEVKVNVSYQGRSEVWRIYMEQTATSVEMNYVEPWTRVAWLSASGVDGNENGFLYREVGSEEWLAVEGVIDEGGEFSACLEGLEPLTAYECKAFSGEDETIATTFTTDAERQLPNAGFETYSHAESANYFSYFDPASSYEELQTKWWDSGNIGSTTVGAAYAIAGPDAEDKMEGEYSAVLTSRNVIIKFAAGNTFSGEFAGLVGTQGGIVNFGRPFTQRPRELRLWLKYVNGPIDCFSGAPDGDNVKAGDPDRGQVFIALGDWDYRKYGGTRNSPVQVNTTDKSTFFKPEGENVIAYGSRILDNGTGGWVEVSIPLVYTDVTRKPTHIIVSCASSMYGDYFTGSSQSRMWIDDMRLVY